MVRIHRNYIAVWWWECTKGLMKWEWRIEIQTKAHKKVVEESIELYSIQKTTTKKQRIETIRGMEKTKEERKWIWKNRKKHCRKRLMHVNNKTETDTILMMRLDRITTFTIQKHRNKVTTNTQCVTFFLRSAQNWIIINNRE